MTRQNKKLAPPYYDKDQTATYIELKYLGLTVILDNKVNFKLHIANILSKDRVILSQIRSYMHFQCKVKKAGG